MFTVLSEFNIELYDPTNTELSLWLIAHDAQPSAHTLRRIQSFAEALAAWCDTQDEWLMAGEDPFLADEVAGLAEAGGDP